MSTRPFPFRVRPAHRETIGSLTRRVLEANGEPATLPQRLLTEQGLQVADWPALLHRKNRSTLHPALPVGLAHRDGTTCTQCTDLLTTRWMCTSCAAGAHIEQTPHFGPPVCVRHHRWVGYTDAPDQQHPVDTVTVRAALRYTALVRQGRMDVRLYGLVTRAISSACGWDEARAFPAVIALISATTDPAFLHRVLHPTTDYTDAYALVDAASCDAAEQQVSDVTRVMWLAMRTAFAAAHAVTTGTPVDVHPHDFPVPPAVLGSLPIVADAEPFGAFLVQTGDTTETAAAYLGDTYARLDPGTRRRHVICAHGHGYTTTMNEPTCPRCPRGGAASYGVNDLATVAPDLAAEFDADANGVTASMVPASSHRKYQWRCTAKNHPYTATPSNRTQTGAACPVCQNRIILPGTNDFAARFPEVFAELAPSDMAQYNPHRNTPASGKLARWNCTPAGHRFKATFSQRANGYSCPHCRQQRAIATSGSFADNHPELAAEWVTGADGRGPAQFSAGSSHLATWRCPLGHQYTARIERRVHGTGCPYCANRTVLAGFNDLRTTHPRLVAEWDPTSNELGPDEVFAGATARRWWWCRNGHQTYQSVPNRLLSHGCTSCAPTERLLHPESEQAAHAPLDSFAPPRHPQPLPEGLDGTDEDEMVDTISRLYASAGFEQDTIVDAWAEAAGFTDDHPDPALVLRDILANTPFEGGYTPPAASDIAAAVDELPHTAGTALPAPLQLVSATRAALRVILTCEGPWETEGDFRKSLARLLGLDLSQGPQVTH